MMNIQLNLILNVFIASFVLTSVQSQNEMIYQAVPNEVTNENGISENFQNLFDSVGKKDTGKSEIYHKFLTKNVETERQAFDTMKEELQITQLGNTLKKSNFYKKTGDNENALAVKREADETEDIKYVDLYGNDETTSGIWQRVRHLASNTAKLKQISYDAHIAVWPYYREGIDIETAFVTNEILMFPGTNFTDINADLIAYKLAGLPKVTFYLTKGLKPTCIYYVWKIKKAGPKWELKNHVCDLSV